MKSINFASAWLGLLCVSAFSLHAAAPASLRPLFNGKDLSGWKGEGYQVEGDAIVCSPNGKVLMTESTFANYVLDFEFLLAPGANNGLGIHYPGQGDGAYAGMELQILEDSHPKYKDLKEYQFHGSLYGMLPAKRGALKAPGQWNHERVTVVGPLLKVEVNGQEVLNTNLDEMAAKFPDHQGVKRRAGHIAFLGHGDRAMFRKVRITELAPEVNAAAIQAAGYRNLFDGKSLSGWKHSPETRNWFASHGILKHTGQSGPINDLWTEKSYRNFTLVFDWRWSGRGPLKQQPAVQPDGTENGTVKIEEFDSGVYLRGNTKSQVNLWNWPIGSGEVYGYRTDRSMSAEVRAGVTPKSAEDRPIGEWNRTKITLKDDLLSVELNGVMVINEAQLPGIPADGALGLQHHGSAIDFANLWIKEL